MEKQNSKSVGNGNPFQNQLDIKEIKENVIVLKDGSLRAVLAVSSINFDLKSDREQQAIIYTFQNFLNSLDFTIQIVISSKRFDINPYIRQMEERKRIEMNDLLKKQIDDYIDFVGELTQYANIMTKLFFVVIPFYPIESKKESFLEKLSNSFNPQKKIYQDRELFQAYKSQLFQRVHYVSEGLSGTGVKIVPLNTAELIELFYNFYNPSEFQYVDVQSSLGGLEIEE